MADSVAFLVLAHKQPEQVRRLIGRLYPHPVFVHIDARSPASVYQPIAELASQGQVGMLPRSRTGWASWGYVEAVLGGLREALRTGCTHVVAMTGQCYPLWPLDPLTEHLSASPQKSWIHQWPIPVPPRAMSDRDGGVGRITHWHITVKGRHLTIPVRRTLPEGLVPHYGQMQCCIAAPLADWLLAEVDRRPELVRYFRHTQAPDELLIPTLAMSSPFADRVESANLWYANWFGGGAHPKTLTTDDFESIADHAKNGGDMCGPSPVKLFARKFDQFTSSDLLDRIDRELLGVQAPE